MRNANLRKPHGHQSWGYIVRVYIGLSHGVSLSYRSSGGKAPMSNTSKRLYTVLVVQLQKNRTKTHEIRC
jgi:hypothetical protein